MSSNGFDFPPASDSSTPIGTLTRRFDSLRQTFNNHEDRTPPPARERESGIGIGMPILPAPSRRLRPMRRVRQEAMDATARRRIRAQVSATTESPERVRQVGQLRRIRQEMREGDGEIGAELRERRDLLERMSNHLDGMYARLHMIGRRWS